MGISRFESRRRSGLFTAIAMLLLLPSSAWPGASDIDLFAGSGNLPPNILIMLDSSGSMRSNASGGGGRKIDIAKTALTSLIKSINPPDGSGGYVENARFGLFIFRSHGGLLQAPIASGNTGTVLSIIDAQTAAGGVGTPIAGAALDIGRYFAGSGGWGSLQKWGEKSSEPAITDPFDFACRETYLIYISDGEPNKDEMEHSGFWATIGDADGDKGAGEGGEVENDSDIDDRDHEWGDDITFAMAQRDFSPLTGHQGVTTHVIGFDIDLPLLERMAINGGGKYYIANSASALATALSSATTAVFDDVASYSTAVVPTSRTRFGSAFYNAFFEPEDGEPFWEGHLEAFGLTPEGLITDRDGNPAVDPLTDLLVEPHRPFWDAADRIKLQPSRSLYTTKGGVRIDFSIANVGSDPTELAVADFGIVPAEIGFYPNASSSGISTETELRDAIIGYLHGEDAFDEDNDNDHGELRDKVLGDIFHSTPRIVGSPTTQLVTEPGYRDFYLDYWLRDRVIYAGANDGMLHAFDAGTLVVGDDPATTTIVESLYYTAGTGDERFGYVPGLLLDQVKLVPRNSPRTYYFVDGSPVVADVWRPSTALDVTREKDEWASILVTGFREGGEGYLALDVTDPGATSGLHGPYPRFEWEFTDASLGQAWSEPVITRVKVEHGMPGDYCGPDDGEGGCRERWVMIVGGGYDRSADPNTSDFDSNPASGGWTDRSKSILMVDIASGTVLARVEFDAATNADMIYALPSTPAVLDLDFDGFGDVVYIGDLGGQIWKWDISAVGADSDSDGEIDNWPSGVFFATPSEDMGGGVYHYRSFFYPPAASFVRGNLVLAFGSGEREDLRYPGDASYDENNRIYTVTDPSPTGANAFATIYSELYLTDITAKYINDDPTKAGFYFDLADGEKIVSDILIFAGYVIATSFSPEILSADPCLSASGVSALYAFRIDNGAGLFRSTASTPPEARKEIVGMGVASTPRISISPDPSHDQIYVKTSKGQVLTIDPPSRSESGSSVIYWRQKR